WISKPAARDPRDNLPTVVEPEDPETAESVASSRDKALVRDAARSTVSVSSIALDGKVIDQQTRIVIGWKETKKCARILTSSDIVDGLGPNIKLHIGLPNRTILEGQLLFFNKYYDIALLEISSESDLPLQLPSFGSNPNYGQEVFVLARGKDSNLMARHGRVLWFEDPKYLNRNYLMLLSCNTPNIRSCPTYSRKRCSMALEDHILAISTILTCIEMWMKFSRIARPEHGLSLRTVELLEVSLQAVISLDHNINNGYIVDKVSIGSTAEKLGIRYGDVIVSFDGLRDQALPQLEDYLLSLGWGFLQGSTDSSSTVDLKFGLT
uniref:PDZ domain-containing protein n=1 Tax=Setaria italica TaxID=4555 RepID=K3ZDD7_SETIT